MKREVISVHIGQAGVQTGISIWELFLLEHCIDPDGFSAAFSTNEDGTFRSFFEEIGNNRYVPRTIFLDTEYNAIDEIRTGVYGNLFHPDQLISGNSDAANNFARGSMSLSKKYMHTILRNVRKSVEICDRCQGFLLNHSIGGGTGSGLTSALLKKLQSKFRKYTRIQMPIFPGPCLASAIVEPYNSVLHINTTMNSSDMVMLFDNEALYDICHKYLYIASPNFSNVNRIIALINSAITVSLRFDGVLNTTLTDLLTNLIPFPRIHFPLVSYVPLMHQSCANHEALTTKLMLKNVFSQNFQTMRSNLNHGFYIAVVLNGRGLITYPELNDEIIKMKSKLHIKFVDWSPKGFKLCLNNQIPSIVPESEIAFFDKTLTMICNSTAVNEYWLLLLKRFDTLYEKRAFMHWYFDEGMEESDFYAARNDILTLRSDYKLITEKSMIP